MYGGSIQINSALDGDRTPTQTQLLLDECSDTFTKFTISPAQGWTRRVANCSEQALGVIFVDEYEDIFTLPPQQTMTECLK
jgi:hypothetical protein